MCNDDDSSIDRGDLGSFIYIDTNTNSPDDRNDNTTESTHTVKSGERKLQHQNNATDSLSHDLQDTPNSIMFDLPPSLCTKRERVKDGSVKSEYR